MPHYIKNSGFTKHWQSAHVGSNLNLNSDGSGSADHYIRKLNFSPGGEFILVHGRNISSSDDSVQYSPKWTYLQLHQSQSGVKGGFELANKNYGSSEVFYAELGVDIGSFSEISTTARDYRERFFVNTEWITNREFIIMTRDGLETGSAYPLPGQTIAAGGNGTGNAKIIVMTGSEDGTSWTVHQEIGASAATVAAANNNFVSDSPIYLRGKAGLAANYKWEPQPTNMLAVFSQDNVNQYSGSLEPSRNYITILERDMSAGGWSFHSNLAVGHATSLGVDGSATAFAEIDIEHVSWIGSGEEQETHLLVQYGTGHHTKSTSPVAYARQEIFKYNGSSWERYTQSDGTTYAQLSTYYLNRQAMFLNQAPQYNPFSKKLTYMYPYSDSYVWLMQFPSSSGWIPDYLENWNQYSTYGQQLSEDAAQASRVGVNSVKWNFYSGGLSAVYAMNGAYAFPNVGLTGTMQLYYVESGSGDAYGWYGARTGLRQGEVGLYFNNNGVQSGSQYGDTSKIYHHAYRENWDTDTGKGGAYGPSGNRFIWEGTVSANRTPGGGRTQALILAHMDAFPAADPAIEDSVTESVTVSGGTVKAGGTEGTPDVTVTIPANGLEGTTTLGADVTGDSNPLTNGLSQLAPRATAASKLISLTPHGTQFKNAVTIQFDLTDTSAGTINIYKRNSPSGAWYGVPRNLWSRSGNTITIETTSFSDYMAVIGDSNMARTILNNAQLAKLTQQNKVAGSSLDITGSGPSRATLLAGDHFLVQPSGAGVPMPISASVMREFFSEVAVESTDVGQAHRVIFAEHTGSNPGLKVDASTFTFNPSTDTLTVTNIDGATIGSATPAAGTFTDLVGTSLDINGAADISGDLTLSAGGDGALRFSAASSIKMLDNSATSLVIEEADNAYLTFDTTNSSEQVIIHQNVSLSDKNLTNVGDINADEVSVDDATVGLNINFGGNTGLDKITLADSQADALSVTDGTDDFLVFDTSGEKITLGKKLEAGSVEIETSNIDINGGEIDGATIGANTAAAGTFTALTANGNVILGDAATDTVTVNADLASDLIPSADNTHDLGDGSNRYAQAHVVEAHIDTLGQALDVNSQNITNVASVSGTLASFHAVSASHARIENLDVININTVTQTETHLSIVDKVIMVASGSAGSDVTGAGLQFGGHAGGDDVASIFYDDALNTNNGGFDFNIDGSTFLSLHEAAILPASDDAIDLGASGAEFKDLYINGTANLDAVDIDGGNIDSTVIGGTTAAAASFTTISSSAGLQVNSDAKVTGELSASLFVGNGQGLTNVGASTLAAGDASLDLEIPFVSGSGQAAAKLFTKDAVLTYNPATDTLKGVNFSGSGDLNIGGAANVDGDLDVDGGVTVEGRVVVDDTTEATSTTDGSLQTDGGLSVAKSAVIGDDLDLLSDNAILTIGSTSKFALTDQAANNTVMATSGHRLAFGTAGEYVSGDGTDLLLVSTGDVKVTGDLVPSADNSVDLGTTALAWRDIHLEGDIKAQDAMEIDTAAGAITIDGAAGVDIQEGGTSVITVDTDRDVLFASTGGSTSDPDVEFDGYTRFDGTAEFDGSVDIDGAVTLDNASVTFSALATLNASTVAQGDKFIIQDADASGVAKEITMAHVGHYLANTGSSTGIQVDPTTGRMSIKYIEQVFMHNRHSGSNADGHSVLTNNITASLSEIPLDDSLQVFLNGMLQTRSGSAGAGIFDYEYVTDTNPRKVQLVAGVDEDDVVVLKYIKK